MTGGQALVRSLHQEGIEVIFGLPGIQLDWAFDALYEERDHIRVYHTRHEQATAYMADGYARTTGRIGTCLVVPGPGLLNATAGLATAYACSSPVLCLTGQINSDLIGLGRGVLHEIPNQLRMVGSVTKWAVQATHPTEIPRLVREAARQLRSGRPRPVELEIPPDVLQQKADVSLLASAGVEPTPGDPDLIERAARALGQAHNPVIFSGGGVLSGDAWHELQVLADMLQAPVFMSDSGRGALSDRSHLAQPPAAMLELLPSADVIFAIGTRFVQSTTPLWPTDSGRVCIQLDVDPSEIGRNLKPTLGIVGDAKRGLAALIERTARHNRARPSRQDELVAIKKRWEAEINAVEPQASLARAIRAELPDDGILVGESTQVGYWAHIGFPVFEPRTYLTSGYQGTLGYGFATALGAQVGNPAKKVVSINGDGGFMYNVQELSTMARHNINVVTVIFEDGAFGNVRRIQQQSFGGRTIASDLLNPDFVKLADSFGIRGIRANGPKDLQSAVREALRADAPALIVVPVGEMRGVPPHLRGRQAAPQVIRS
ncbi:MAG: thiamine pyrophosphate-binding protein [Chloroflexi bacterium]|nr:thiamine pyrophosphate-binding protein [Chloroflexota bacterium]